jgi:ATPase subunit of ABC transporter with duplicated ATPase domains
MRLPCVCSSDVYQRRWSERSQQRAKRRSECTLQCSDHPCEAASLEQQKWHDTGRKADNKKQKSKKEIDRYRMRHSIAHHATAEGKRSLHCKFAISLLPAGAGVSGWHNVSFTTIGAASARQSYTPIFSIAITSRIVTHGTRRNSQQAGQSNWQDVEIRHVPF